MYCTKCGTNNEDDNAFCKNCGAKLVKPAVNSPVNPVPSSQGVSSSSGVVQAAKPVNVKLIAGLATMLVVAVMAVVVMLMKDVSGKDSLFEQIKIGKTTAADVEKYFDKNNLGCERTITDTKYIKYLSVFRSMGHDFRLLLDQDDLNDANYSFVGYANTITVCNNLSDTLWGSDCEYFISVSGEEDDKDKKRKVLYTSCVVTIDGKNEEREFRQHLNEYLKKHQKTELETLSSKDGNRKGITYYPLQVTNWNGDKVLTCLCYNDALLESDGIILLTLYDEVYYTDEELNKLLKEQITRNREEEYIVDIGGEKRTEHSGMYLNWINGQEYSVGIYFLSLLNKMYPEFEKAELEAIQKEAPDFVCDFSSYYDSKGTYGKNIKIIVIKSCNQSAAGDIVIPESIHDYPVMRIAEDAFLGCSNLKSITIPDSVKYIGNNAFSGCSNLTEITIPDGVEYIGNNTFSGCSSLTEIAIPDSVEYIGNNAFSGCISLESIKIPDSVTNIGSNVFADCNSLTDITLPNGITEIKDGTFSGCGSLTDIKIPSSVTTIGNKAFENCGSLMNINIDNNITVVADNAFDGCEILVSIELNVRFPNAVPKPAWLEAYREFEEDRNCNCINFVDGHSSGIPYLVEYGSYLYHYNGTEVESTFSAINMEFNSVSNKAMADSHIALDGVTGFDFYLVDLYTGSIELSCTEIYHHDGSDSEYYGSDDNKISKEEYNRISNEMNNLFGSGGYWLEQNYSSVDKAYQAYVSDQGSISTSATNASESANTALVTDASASDNNINIDVESEVKQIRQWYSDTQNRLDNLMYSKYGDGIEYYFELGYAVKGIISSGYDGWGYTRQYFYKDQKLYFAFVFKGSEEYRIYFKDGKVIRYIDNNGTIYNYGNIGDDEQLGQKIIAKSDKLYPEFNCGA